MKPKTKIIVTRNVIIPKRLKGRVVKQWTSDSIRSARQGLEAATEKPFEEIRRKKRKSIASAKDNVRAVQRIAREVKNDTIIGRFVRNFRALYANGGAEAMAKARKRASRTPIETD